MPEYRAIHPAPVAKAQARLNRIAAEPSVFMVYPHLFKCRRCGTAWKADPPMNIDLKEVTCSNCYGENVFVLMVKITRFEEKP